jgi:Carboxypeptidase regulatory-like domain
MSIKTRWLIVATAWLVAALAAPASAQLTTGSVTGSVKDGQGGVIPGATVTVINESRGTTSVPVVTNETGAFVVPNLAAGTYTIQVEIPSFKTLKQTGIMVNPGTRADVGALTLEVGGTSEVVDVKGESPVVQATSGERSFTIPTESVENLPIANRGFSALAALAPRVSGTSRIGGGGATNIMMDGISTMDTGNNGQLLQMTSESIAE